MNLQADLSPTIVNNHPIRCYLFQKRATLPNFIPHLITFHIDKYQTFGRVFGIGVHIDLQLPQFLFSFVEVRQLGE